MKRNLRDRQPMQGRILVLVSLCVMMLTSWASADYRICTWNVLRLSDTDSQNATRVSAMRTVLSTVDPDVLVVQEIEGSTASINFLNNVLNGPGGPGGGVGDPDRYERGSFQTLGTGLDNAIYFRSALFQEQAASFEVLDTQPRDTPVWRLRPVIDATGDNDLYVYSMHLKAGNSGPDASDRAVQATIVRNHANNLPAGTHFVYAGDFNVYDSSEAAYVDFIGSQPDDDGRAFDPINRPGNWSNNSSFADIHTQSPFASSGLAPNDATGGGMDDRFDFILISDALQDSVGMDYIASSYTAFGNDGLHLNDDITDAPTIPEGSAMADALVSSADHLPVFLDLTEPIVIPSEAGLTPTGVITFSDAFPNASAIRGFSMTNVALPGSGNLDFSLTALPAGFTNITSDGPFSLPPGGVQNFVIRRDPSPIGLAFGTLTFETNDPTQPVINRTLIARVVNHARPSVTMESESLNGLIEVAVDPEMISNLALPVFNFGFVTGETGTLEVSGASFDANPSGRFSTTSFVPLTDIADVQADALITFDAIGAVPGDYVATVRLTTRDDQDVLGALDLADLVYDITVTVDGLLLGDFDNSGVVDTADIPGMVALLLAPASASANDQAIGDLNQDTVNDAADIAGFVDAMLN